MADIKEDGSFRMPFNPNYIHLKGAKLDNSYCSSIRWLADKFKEQVYVKPIEFFDSLSDMDVGMLLAMCNLINSDNDSVQAKKCYKNIQVLAMLLRTAEGDGLFENDEDIVKSMIVVTLLLKIEHDHRMQVLVADRSTYSMIDTEAISIKPKKLN